MYYELTKPGIVYGNALTALAGFLFATHDGVAWGLLGAMLVGLSLIVASACVFNNVYDRDIDALMERTKNRALARGDISPRAALIYGSLLGLLGVVILFIFTNTLTLASASAGWLIYLFAYTPLKRVTGHSLFVGAVSGAMPPVVGYVAVANTLDLHALGLFLFLFIWQIAHFVAIALYRYDEYTAARIPLLVSRPSEQTRLLARKSFYLSLVVLLFFTIFTAFPMTLTS